MKTFREELIEVRNKIDELIMQLGTETEVTSTPEEPLENIIFNTRLFNTPEKLLMLKQTIGSFICENPTKDEMKIDAKKMNQFFCLYAALWSRPNVLANECMADFVRQMALWFPLWKAGGALPRNGRAAGQASHPICSRRQESDGTRKRHYCH
ncbi:MAG: hypothetical protein IJY59_00215 [Bacteroidaceae bacterium]|nr:hypothetical protein [Bacteroidaceae bacterium]